MYYGVKFYSGIAADEKPLGIPDLWPCECVRPDENGTGYLYSRGYTILTQEDLQQEKLDHFEEYAAWAIGHYGEIR